MSTSTLKSFESNLNGSIIESLKACMEAPEDESGEPDWSAYDDFVNHLSTNIFNHVKELAAAIEKSAPKVSKPSTKGGKGGAKRNNTYTQWVRVASNIRKGNVDGNKEVTVGSHFSNPSAAAASKYDAMKDDLELDGETMTVDELLTRLKESLPGEKDLTLTAIAWGLMPKDFRDNLVAELDG